MIGSASPCLLAKTSHPPHSWSCRLKSPASNTSTRVPNRFRVSQVSWSSLLIATTSASSFCPSQCTQVFEADVGNSIKCIFVPGSTTIYRLLSLIANVTCSGGWFRGAYQAPDTKLNKTVLDESIFVLLRESLTRNRFLGLASYYLNYSPNKIYSKSATNSRVLKIPILFIKARYNRVLLILISRLFKLI